MANAIKVAPDGVLFRIIKSPEINVPEENKKILVGLEFTSCKVEEEELKGNCWILGVSKNQDCHVVRMEDFISVIGAENRQIANNWKENPMCRKFGYIKIPNEYCLGFDYSNQ